VSLSKFIPFNNLSHVIRNEKESGNKIIHCHGTFDLIHPGHIIHFEEAKGLGDILVVTITSEDHVNKGPGRPYFNDELRVRSLISLEFIDYVSVIPFPAAVEAIEAVCPDIYCKGKEYEKPEIDVTGNINDDLKTVQKVGGKVAYVGSVVFSSSEILNNHFKSYSLTTKELLRNISKEFPISRLRKTINDFPSIKVLVIGDLILDRYSTVSVQGLTSKNRILSSRFVDENIQAGGSLAIFRHIREFTPQVKLLSLAGTEPWLDPLLKNYLSKEEDWIQREPDFTTIIKHRFVEPLSDGKELSKLFSVNHIDNNHTDSSIQKRLSAKLRKKIKDFDLVLVADFGHGVMTKIIREIVQEKANYIALNCQTNSNNYGFNIINRQYERADSFSLDQVEMSLACGQRQFDGIDELQNLIKHFGSRYGWFTRGGTETIGITPGSPPCLCESLEKVVVDTVGAGDAFCSVASLAAAQGLPIELATLMGQISGALAVRIFGNSECVTKHKFLKATEALLKY
jgi:cytidyltransferase-like protein